MEAKSHNLDSEQIQGKYTENDYERKGIGSTTPIKKIVEGIIVSQYKIFKINIVNKSLLEIFGEIRSGKYKTEIDSLRLSLSEGDQKTADKIKRELPAFTTSGTFGISRTRENLKTYSQILCLDYDDIPCEELEIFSKKVNECPFTFASFKSPSGVGIKVFVKVNSTAYQHVIAYNQVANQYKVLTDYECDEKCKDISRLCFVSSDSELHFNEIATIFEVKEGITQSREYQRSGITKFQWKDASLDKCLIFTEQKEQYAEGNRNNFIYLFASNANRYGIDEAQTLDYCITNFDLNEKEIKSTVSNVYKNQNDDFAKFAKFAEMQTNEFVLKEPSLPTTLAEEEDYLKSTPIIPKSVYENLPPILFESCQVFKEPRERDVFLTGALTILSGCLPNVSGIYSGSKVFPSLFSFILAPAASGKGSLKFAKTLADKYHYKTLAQSKEEKNNYDKRITVLKAQNTKAGNNQAISKKPNFKVVFIPANTSNAKIIQHLESNEGRGIICETEADTLGQTFKKEWGSYSDMLRKSFHHEKISISRKTDDEFIEVNNPQLSVVLSGTPKQVFNIITSAEDGLFSRFIFYVFKSDSVWLDPSPKGNPVNLTEFFSKRSSQVFKMVEFFENDSMVLHLTEEQWDRFNAVFSSYLIQITAFVSEDAQSAVKRLGLILYRFCMIFTAIRKFSSKIKDSELYCKDEDFDSALSLVEVYLQHSVKMFSNLPKQEAQGSFKSGDNKKLFFDALPKQFYRKEAVEIGKKFNIAERSVDSLLKIWKGSYLHQPKNGSYEKTK